MPKCFLFYQMKSCIHVVVHRQYGLSSLMVIQMRSLITNQNDVDCKENEIDSMSNCISS